MSTSAWVTRMGLGRVVLLATIVLAPMALGDTDLVRAYRRASYLLSGRLPEPEALVERSSSDEGYRRAVRDLVQGDSLYEPLLRYHERLLGTGLAEDYLSELIRDDLDGKARKFAQIVCRDRDDGRFGCLWASEAEGQSVGSCQRAHEEPTAVFWYPARTAWVCPSIQRACGRDLSRCFVVAENQDIARNTELGTSETFDSRLTVVKSLSRQGAGLATAVVMENFPYTRILEPGLTAVDGAIVNFLRQAHHFDLAKLHVPQELQDLVRGIDLTDTRYRLVQLSAESATTSGGVLSTYAWLRRYEKNRTRANQLYERLLCRQFTSELPRVFPADPGNLRETDGCKGCHATLDPLADFFGAWGEQDELYADQQAQGESTFAGRRGSGLADLARIIQEDQAFAACTVQNVWSWLMGRRFYHAEEPLRDALAQYFRSTDMSLRELIFAVVTHPAFTEGRRSDALVGDPLAEPPLGEITDAVERACPSEPINYAADIAPGLSSRCVSCHGASSSPRVDLSTQSAFESAASTVASLIASGSMPPGQAGPPTMGTLFDLKEAVRCYVEQNP